MKLTLNQIVNLQLGLKKISDLSENDFSKSKIKFKLAFITSKLIQEIQTPVEYYLKLRTEKLSKYATEIFTIDSTKVDKEGIPIKQSTGNFTFISEEARISFNDEMTTELNRKIELPNFYKLKIEDVENIGLGVPDITSLYPIIEDTEKTLELIETTEIIDIEN